MSVVTVFVTSSKEAMSAATSERRFDKGTTIVALKGKLQAIVGSQPGMMRLQLLDQRGQLVGALDDDSRMLGYYPVEDYMTIHVVDVDPVRKTNEFSDLSSVPKYEMPDEEYSKRQDTVRAYKERHKIGRFQDAPPAHDFATEAQRIHVGERCEVLIEDLPSRGTVRYESSCVCTGLVKGKEGYFVGVELDEPVGRNDGAVDGERYFQAAGPRRAVFTRPTLVKVGDYPELDLDEL